MKKMLGLFGLFMLASLPAMAQYSGPRVEVNGGYTFLSFDTPGGGPRTNFNGWDAGVAFNVTSWLSGAADFDGGYSSPGGTSVHALSYMFGPRIYPMGHHKVTPFVHALFGDSHITIPSDSFTDDAFAWEIGGGVDYSIGEHIAIRVAEIDYEQTRNFQPGPNQNNFKYKGGIVFRF
jgi:opacity protein-like surface antigen